MVEQNVLIYLLWHLNEFCAARRSKFFQEAMHRLSFLDIKMLNEYLCSENVPCTVSRATYSESGQHMISAQ